MAEINQEVESIINNYNELIIPDVYPCKKFVESDLVKPGHKRERIPYQTRIIVNQSTSLGQKKAKITLDCRENPDRNTVYVNKVIDKRINNDIVIRHKKGKDELEEVDCDELATELWDQACKLIEDEENNASPLSVIPKVRAAVPKKGLRQ